MSISAISSNAYWLTSATKAVEKQATSADFTAADSTSTTTAASRASATKLTASTGQTLPGSSLSGASNAVLLALQEIDSPNRPEGLTDSQWLTQLTASFSATDYIQAKMMLSEKQSAERIASGEATDTFKVRFNDQTFTMTGKAYKLSDLPTTQLPDGVALRQFAEIAVDQETQQAHMQAAMNAEARQNNPFHDVVLPENSIGLFQEHLPNIDLGGKMLAVTFPEGTQRIDVTKTASQITQDANGTIRVPAGLKWQLISPPSYS